MRIAWLSGFLLLALACARPREEQAAPHPIAPPPSYEDVVARIARRQASDDSVVAQGGRSVLMTHGRRIPRAIRSVRGIGYELALAQRPSAFDAVLEQN